MNISELRKVKFTTHSSVSNEKDQDGLFHTWGKAYASETGDDLRETNFTEYTIAIVEDANTGEVHELLPRQLRFLTAEEVMSDKRQMVYDKL